MDKHIILSPHYDDAVLSLGGFIKANSQKVVVVTVLGGIPQYPLKTSWDIGCGFADSNQALAYRLVENEKALLTLDVAKSDIVNWDYLDRQYRLKSRRFFNRVGEKITSQGGQSESSIYNILSEKQLKDAIWCDIEKLLFCYRAFDISLYVPMFMDHPDHALVSNVVKSMLPHLREKNIACYLYQDLPYAYRFLNPSVLFRKAPLCLDYYAQKRIGCAVTKKVLELSDLEFDMKLTALKAYASQNDSLGWLGTSIFNIVRRFASAEAHLSTANFAESVYLVK